jgi:hypothetical protein
MDCTVSILSFNARVIGPSQVIDLVQSAFPLACWWSTTIAAEPSVQIRVNMTGDGDAWQLLVDDAAGFVASDLAELAVVLEWLITSKALDHLGRDHLLFHAGAIAFGELGCILPAQSGSGKSTLTAALIAEGMSYLSDEVAIISSDCGCLVPFAKSITVKPGSHELLGGRYSELIRTEAEPGQYRTQVTHLKLPPNCWPSKPVRVRHIVFLEHVPGAKSHMKSLSRSEGLALLLENSFSAARQGSAGIRRVVEFLRSAECCSVVMGDLSDAVLLVRRLMGA